jgi:hypothetical protein
VDERNSGRDYVRLFYTLKNNFTGERVELDYKVELVTTSFNFGGSRSWFICPLVVNRRPCDRRVSKLYLPPRGRYFGCRHCYNLTYRCQKEHDSWVDTMVKNPEMLLSHMRGRDFKASLKAYFKIAGKM